MSRAAATLTASPIAPGTPGTHALTDPVRRPLESAHPLTAEDRAFEQTEPRFLSQRKFLENVSSGKRGPLRHPSRAFARVIGSRENCRRLVLICPPVGQGRGFRRASGRPRRIVYHCTPKERLGRPTQRRYPRHRDRNLHPQTHCEDHRSAVRRHNTPNRTNSLCRLALALITSHFCVAC